MNGFASLLGWLAAAAVLVVFVHRWRKRKNSSLTRDGAARSARHVALSLDFTYLQKQAANLHQLKKEALSSGDEADLFVEELEWRQYLDDAAAFVAEARADGSPELLVKAAKVQRLLLSLDHHIDKAKPARA